MFLIRQETVLISRLCRLCIKLKLVQLASLCLLRVSLIVILRLVLRIFLEIIKTLECLVDILMGINDHKIYPGPMCRSQKTLAMLQLEANLYGYRI